MALRELLSEIATRYPTERLGPFEGNSLAKLIREQSASIISPMLADESLTVRGSAGMTTWTFNPWIAIFNKNETDGPREGVYVAYLFSNDLARVYLTIMQGTDKLIEENGRKVAFEKINAMSSVIKADFEGVVLPKGFKSDNNIHLAEKGRGANYERSVIFYKEYETSNLPDENALIEDMRLLVFVYNKYVLYSDITTIGTDLEHFAGGIAEGRKILVTHYIRERDPSIIKKAKERALALNGELKCEICNFSFSRHYGDRAQDFIEGHHKKSISTMTEGELTSIDDIALVCSNCHSVIHLKMPWLTIEEIRRLYH